MSDTGDSKSGNTTELATRLSALTTVAATTTTMVARSKAQLALFTSLLVALTLSVHLYRETR